MGNLLAHPSLTLSILEFSPLEERNQIRKISRDYRRLATELYVEKWMCFRLMEDYKLYHSLKLSPGNSWRQVYCDLRCNINLWTQASKSHNDVGSRAKIQVYSRFRPFDKSKSAPVKDDTPNQKVITLPLHQRLTLIKLSHGLKSNNQALQVLKEEGSWFGKRWADLDLQKAQAEENKENNSSENSTQQRTKITMKSHLHKMSSAPLTADIQSVDPGTGRVVIVAPDVGMREFSFDGVLPANATQTQVYERIAAGLVVDVMNGCNATGIMYGQTGSGTKYCLCMFIAIFRQSIYILTPPPPCASL